MEDNKEKLVSKDNTSVNKTRRRKPKAIFWILLVVIIAIIITAVCLVLNMGNKKQDSPGEETPEATVVPVDENDLGPTYNIDFAAMKQTNPEYIGRIVFDSGLVDENVVQSEDNDKYLNTSWDLQSSSHGAAFLDYRNGLDDQNLIIYGHFVYKDESLMFSPLHTLKEETSYEANKYFDLVLENETRRYQVAYVYYYTMDDNTLQYFQTNYYEDYFGSYIEAVNKVEFYDTGLELDYTDKFLTLQTCVRNHDELRLIVVGKLITVIPNDNTQAIEATVEATATAE